MTSKPKHLITRAAAAQHAGVSPRTIDNWRHAGLLVTYAQRGGRSTVFVDRDELDRLITPRPVPAVR